MSKLRWLYNAAPVHVRPHTVRNAAAADAIHGEITHIPDVISSKDLPKRIHSIVRKHIFDAKFNEGRLRPNPNVLQIAAPTAPGSASSSTLEEISIPNPFVLTRQQVETHMPYAGLAPGFKWRRLVSKRYQKVLMAKHPRVFLPPSPINPLDKVPKIRWDEKKYGGLLVSWWGDYEPDTGRKGLYHNRTKVFKGKRNELAKVNKLAEIQERLETMDERVAKWREQRAEQKRAKRPALPF